ncbi:MAG: FRG domain-containing protein [Candidatus Cloacimonetes bacterium]|nr:FRG domain-containing protein [Candidatus Cloacimonadota bacterium]
MKEIEIKSIHDIPEQVSRLQKKKTNLEKLVWRGQPDYEYDICPKLHRKKSWLKNEFYMIEELKRRKPESFKHCKSRFEELSICQHYGLPTRLLDLSENPLIALYFACKSTEKEKEKDGEIIPFQDRPLNYWDTRVNCICFFSEILIEKILIESFYNELKAKHNKLLDKKTKDLITVSIKTDQALTIFPVINNDRLMIQQGVFLIFSANVDKDHKYFIKDTSNINKDLYKKNGVRFRIHKRYKDNILKELKFYGITKARLFPEIEYQCSDIKNSYS